MQARSVILVLQQRALAKVLERVPAEIFLEVETNGTRVPLPALLERIDQWNVSPKLASAGDPEAQRIKPEALLALRDTGRAFLKVVVRTAQDKQEAESLRQRFGFARDHTLLMPEASSPDELEQRYAARVREELRGIVLERLQAAADHACRGATFDELVGRVAARDVDAYAAVAALLDDSGGNA